MMDMDRRTMRTLLKDEVTKSQGVAEHLAFEHGYFCADGITVRFIIERHGSTLHEMKLNLGTMEREE